MRVVRDGEGRRYLLEGRGDESWIVRDPATGEREHREAADLDVEGGAMLGLLCHLDARGPRSVVDLLDETTLCESDLHGLLAECRAEGLVAEERVGGRRGYALTDAGRSRLD